MTPNDIVTDPNFTDWGVRAQRAAEAHLEACEEALYAAEGEEGEDQDEPGLGPYCGCTTCVVREVLYAAWPILRQAALDGAV